MQVASGRVIPLYSHGLCVYLTENERRRLTFLNHTAEGFAVSFLFLLLLNRVTSSPQKLGQATPTINAPK